MGLKDLIDAVKQEWPVIRQTPLTIILSVLLLTIIAGVVEYGLFKESISRKNDLIDTLTRQLGAKNPPQTQQASPSPPHAEPSTGSATTSGNGSPAISGNGNTVGYSDTKSSESKQPKR